MQRLNSAIYEATAYEHGVSTKKNVHSTLLVKCTFYILNYRIKPVTILFLSHQNLNWYP